VIYINQKSVAIGTILIILIVSNIFVCGCINFSNPDKEEKTLEPEDTTLKADDSKATPEGASSVVEANTQFAFELYSEFSETEENIFFSPYSISVALAMTYEGARGQTAKEIQSVFHFPGNNTTRRSSFANIYNQLNKKDKEYILHTANALWAQKDYPFLAEYFDLIKKYYMGEVTNLDFINDPKNSRETINSWVEEQTNDKIKDLIPQGYINYLTRLVLTNAIYFKGNWLKQFDEEDTHEQDFQISNNKTVKVPMMSITDNVFNYTATNEFQILEIPYGGEEISMLILLPNDNNLDSIEDSINEKNLTEWRNNLYEKEIDIYIPKFKFETKYFLKDTLIDMGMPTAFSGGADFSGMDGTGGLFISSVIHQGFIEVNEEGTEATAATGVVMYLGITPSFRADHPFIFLIQDRISGNILFMGRVIDPTK
jgi:serpin B